MRKLPPRKAARRNPVDDHFQPWMPPAVREEIARSARDLFHRAHPPDDSLVFQRILRDVTYLLTIELEKLMGDERIASDEQYDFWREHSRLVEQQVADAFNAEYEHMARIDPHPYGPVLRNPPARPVNPTYTVWYHGGTRISNWSTLRWDRERFSGDPNAEGPGMYWTSDLAEARRYASQQDPVIYHAFKGPKFRTIPARATISLLLKVYRAASRDDQEVFLSNWGMEWPGNPSSALRNYMNKGTFHAALMLLYSDLFRYDADSFVKAMRSLNYDGFVVHRENRDHLVVWNTDALDIGIYAVEA